MGGFYVSDLLADNPWATEVNLGDWVITRSEYNICHIACISDGKALVDQYFDLKGPKGDTGDTGPTGNTGATGATGDTGATGVGTTIKGSYNTYQELINAHPTGNDGDSYLVNGSLYVWLNNDWENVGSIKGDKGDTGASGPKGDTGDTGPQGVKGDTGNTGAKGDTGASGPKGDTGVGSDEEAG